eukprot:2035603-Pyramimonas_sp.AAC.1
MICRLSSFLGSLSITYSWSKGAEQRCTVHFWLTKKRSKKDEMDGNGTDATAKPSGRLDFNAISKNYWERGPDKTYLA